MIFLSFHQLFQRKKWTALTSVNSFFSLCVEPDFFGFLGTPCWSHSFSLGQVFPFLFPSHKDTHLSFSLWEDLLGFDLHPGFPSDLFFFNWNYSPYHLALYASSQASATYEVLTLLFFFHFWQYSFLACSCSLVWGKKIPFLLLSKLSGYQI